MNPTHPTAPASMATHTPTPYYNGSTNRESANIVSADTVIAYVYDKNDRAFILRACNSHAQLVAFAERMARYFDENPNGYDDMRQQARAALSAAKE